MQNKSIRSVFGSLTMIAVIMAVSLNVQAQTILSEELRADSLPSGWSATDVAFTTSASGYANFTAGTGLLTSPSFDLSGVTGATLTYSVAKFGSGSDGPLTIEFSVDGGTTWNAQTVDTGTPTSSTYLNEELELASNLIGEADVRVRFNAANSVSNKRLRDVLIVGPDGVTLAEAIEVSTIAELRAGATDGTRYKLTGEAVLAFYDSFNKRRYLVDGTAGIFSEDPGFLPDTLTTIGQGVTGMEGTLSVVNGGAVIRFNPDAGSTNAVVSSVGNEIVPEQTNLVDLGLNDTGKLVKVNSVTFQETGNFSTGTNYTLEDANGNTLTFRTDYFGADYIGQPIPDSLVNITGLVGGFNSSPQIFARSLADFEAGTLGPVNVTFMINTATVPDTMETYHALQLRGGPVGSNASAVDYSPITWDAASVTATNEGGDYWSLNFQMSPGDTLNYKFWAGVDTSTPLQINGEQGWEFGGDNRQFILPADQAADTTAPLQWVANRAGAPFVSDPDSATIFFRVNVGALVQNTSFDPATDKVGIRGGGQLFVADWGAGNDLTAEPTSINNVNFYNTAVKIDKAAADTIGTVNYKFVYVNDEGTVFWEENGTANRPVNVTSQDTTIKWVYFQNQRPTDAQIISTNLNFEVNVGILEGLGFFNSSIDTMYVRGSFNGFGTANRMDLNPITGTYLSTVPFTGAVGGNQEFKYFVRWDNRRDTEGNEFYLEGITANGSGWEEPGVTGGGNRVLTLEDAEQQPLESNFYNSVEPEALLTSDNVEGGAATVTFSIDMSPATSATTPFVPASDSVYLLVDTPFFALTQGIIVPGDDGGNFFNNTFEQAERLRFTDDDGDMIYTLDLALELPTLNNFGFRVAYGSAFDETANFVPNGEGFNAGRRYYQYIQPQVDADLNVTWPSTFSFPQLTWTATNLPFEQPPSYTTVGNEEEIGNVERFSLDQNYPNPFNPTTNIRFNLPNAASVNLAIYNVLGQKVATLANNRMYQSGSHIVAFDASSLSSGVYFYRIEAGSFVQQRSMTLIK